MKKIATANEMRSLDSAAIQEIGIPGLILMENASLGILRRIEAIFGADISRHSFIIACGKGNNGGDGYALARHLFNRGAEVNVLSICPLSELKGDAKKNAQMFTSIGGTVAVLGKDLILPDWHACDLIVDALLGTGLTGPARGAICKVIDWINNRPEQVLAVDLPSGVESDSGFTKGPAVNANWTVTMGLLKQGLVFPPGRDLAGEVNVALISLPPKLRAGTHIHFNLLEESDVNNMFPRRNPAAHKGDCGRAFIMAGSPGMTGAAALCAQATLRIGAGLVILGIPTGLNAIMEIKLTEAMTRRLAENGDGCLCPDALPKIEESVAWADVIAIGPGLSQHNDTAETIRRLLPNIKKPLVIDADGLNILSGIPNFWKMLPPGSILTPHPVEFSRLCGLPSVEILANRVEIASQKAAEWGTVLVLKGSPTIIADPGGEVYCNPTGNAALATGGSGDVLTGMILGLLAQGCPPLHAACAGPYLHGLAGEIASREIGIAATVAGDLDKFLPHAIHQICPEA
ncbi:MAG: NAD(P)H-hydrate dehydratase [bacterium]|nr:NAD(P)H-hydrate dehydratase [bacterium]